MQTTKGDASRVNHDKQHLNTDYESHEHWENIKLLIEDEFIRF